MAYQVETVETVESIELSAVFYFSMSSISQGLTHFSQCLPTIVTYLSMEKIDLRKLKNDELYAVRKQVTPEETGKERLRNC